MTATMRDKVAKKHYERILTIPKSLDSARRRNGNSKSPKRRWQSKKDDDARILPMLAKVKAKGKVLPRENKKLKIWKRKQSAEKAKASAMTKLKWIEGHNQIIYSVENCRKRYVDIYANK